MSRPKLNEQEIERKLRSAKAPHPPSHLLDRLKADIPDQVTLSSAHPERRPQRFWRNTWAVAASVLALVGMSYVMLRTIESAEVRKDAPAAARSMEPDALEAPASRGVAMPPSTAAAQPQPTAAMSQKIAAIESAPARSAAAFDEIGARRDNAAETDDYADAPLKRERAQKDSGRSNIEGGLGGAIGGAEPQTTAESASDDERLVVAQAEARPVEAPAAAAPPPPAAEPVDATAGAALGTANSRLFRQKEEAKTAGGGQFIDASADPTSTFGLRVRDDSWAAIRGALSRGRLPAASAIREEEVINHFDYRDEASRSEVTLFAEAAPAAFGDSGLYVLRVAVHTGAPVRAAAVQIEFNPEIVRTYRLVGYQTAEGGGESVTRADLPKGTSVSAVYELRLERKPSARQQLAVMRLKWEGRESSLQINGSDVAGTWNASLPSLRLASLAAKWAEMLKGSPFAAAISPRDLMARVQQLSGELAGDAEVAEFVGLVARSVRLME